MVTDTKNVAN